MQVLKLDSKCEDAQLELNVVRTNQLVVSCSFLCYLNSITRVMSYDYRGACLHNFSLLLLLLLFIILVVVVEVEKFGEIC